MSTLSTAGSHLDRLTAVDASFLTNETSSSHMHIGGILIFEGPPPPYVDLVERLSATGHGYLDQGDMPAYPGVYEAGCYVVGSVLDAARGILSGACRRAFVPIAGLHHARRERAAGFCVFNDSGILIEWLRTEAPVTSNVRRCLRNAAPCFRLTATGSWYCSAS